MTGQDDDEFIRITLRRQVHRGIVNLTFDVLEEALGLPAGSVLSIEPERWDILNSRAFRIKIEHPECPALYEGMPYETVRLERANVGTEMGPAHVVWD